MTEEEMINHKKLESAFLHCKDKRKRLSKRCQEQQKIIDLQNSALRRKDNFIKKQEEIIKTLSNDLEKERAKKNNFDSCVS